MKDIIERFNQAQEAGDIKLMGSVFSEFCTKLNISGEQDRLATEQGKRIAERHNKIINPGPGIRKL
jgi:hypothetical protein